MKRSFTVLLVPAIFISLNSCNKCDQMYVADFTFSSKDLSINPYTGSEMLVFKDLNGDSLILANGWRHNDPYTRYQYDYETAKLDNHGCQGDYFTADYNRSGFISDSASGKAIINIDLSFPFLFNHPVYYKNFRLNFHQGENITSFSGDFKFNNDTLYNYPEKHDSIVAFHQHVNVGPKTYTNVYELYGHNGDPRNDEWYSTAWYSVTEGLVGVRSNFGKLWYLDKLIR